MRGSKEGRKGRGWTARKRREEMGNVASEQGKKARGEGERGPCTIKNKEVNEKQGVWKYADTKNGWREEKKAWMGRSGQGKVATKIREAAEKKKRIKGGEGG